MRTSLMLILPLLLLAMSLSATDGQLDAPLLKNLEKAYADRGDQTAIFNAIANNKLTDLTLNHELMARHNEFVNLRLKDAGITNQQGSGRCWIFSGLNVFTPNVARELNIKQIELSQSFLAFYDKLEKANMFLEEIITLRETPIGDRKLRSVLDSPFGDGGWYNYLTGLIEKYGAVPKSAMPETNQSSSTGTINDWTTTLLRNDAAELRQMHQEGKSLKQLRTRKATMLADIYQLLALCYGEPPQSFEYRYKPERDAKADDDSTTTEKAEETVTRTFTPHQFAEEYLKGAMPEYVAFMNDPSRDYGYPYQGEWSRNIWEGSDFTLLNLPIERLKHYALKALLDSQLVWFACDVGREHNSPAGILATGMYQADKLLGVDFAMSKADRLAYGEGQPSHAMALMGVDTSAAGEPLKWLVENSWGKKGNDGLWYMYDDWFDDYVYVVIVDKRLVEPDDLKLLDQKPRASELWNPFFQALKNLQ